MEYNPYLQNCNDNDVVSFSDQMYKLGRIKQLFKHAFTSTIPDILVKSLEEREIKEVSIRQANSKWFSEGKDCEILRIGANGWQKGKLKLNVSLEFYPDEPEVEETPVSKESELQPPTSPLDDLRQMMKEEN